jgi:hypothetical protein
MNSNSTQAHVSHHDSPSAVDAQTLERKINRITRTIRCERERANDTVEMNGLATRERGLVSQRVNTVSSAALLCVCKLFHDPHAILPSQHTQTTTGSRHTWGAMNLSDGPCPPTTSPSTLARGGNSLRAPQTAREGAAPCVVDVAMCGNGKNCQKTHTKYVWTVIYYFHRSEGVMQSAGL